MKRLIINGFKTKEQYRIQFTNFLKEFGRYGLKDAKNLLDGMIDGESIEIELYEKDIQNAESILNKLNMDYYIMN
ncbi:hypothetical protein HME9304_01810 [Flagellimonas maritima]|uniref:Uncharacterized protein n=1 Tax=Flagellimonas maritima TaxID=1383885 RepID=A0A2Z4LSD4_9FLAO|nr:hypothetical protein [Allomuricauda aurantiaca]AWX44805.1 hypothetical protein HME9304_01810 [Allomuricauda aurantiaca]